MDKLKAWWNEHVLPTLRGALKSLTVWFSLALASLPDVLPMVQDNFDAVRPWIPHALQSRSLQLVALIVLLLRMKTKTSLKDKGAPA